MSIQWTAIAVVLYAEVAIIALLLLPWIRPHMWQRLFNSRLVKKIAHIQHIRIYVLCLAGSILLLFFDAARTTVKYSSEGHAHHHVDAAAEAVQQMRLFRAQRNLYVTGFALLFLLLIQRLVSLLQREAHLQAATLATLSQAQGANRAAMTALKEGGGGQKSDEKKVLALKTTIEELEEELEKVREERDAIKEQAENLQAEYDQLTVKKRATKATAPPAE